MELIIVFTGLFILGFIVLLHQVLRSKDDVDLTVSFKKGEMNVTKKKNQ